jgi:NDP-sugar pyrophosphorylase family protein
MSATSGWHALVLAAGLGTRLRPLSDVRAKPALPVAGRPLIARLLERLRADGVARVVINLHHLAETVTRVVGDGAQFGLDTRYSWERDILGSGGGPARAVPLLAADRFFIVNGDTLAEVALDALARAHEASGALVTLAVAPADLAKYNALLSDEAGHLVGVVPRGTPIATGPGAPARAWRFVGVQAVNASAFSAVSRDVRSDTIGGLYPRLAAEHPGSVRVFPIDGAFFDIGTPADYLDTVRHFAAAEGREFDRGTSPSIAASARLTDCILWDRVTIGADATLTRCVIADDVAIPAGAQYDGMAITRHTAARL